MMSDKGYATLISPSYIVGVRHNGGFKTIKFGNGAKYAATYTLINRNNMAVNDFHAPRLNKVATDAAPVDFIGRAQMFSPEFYKDVAVIPGLPA